MDQQADAAPQDYPLGRGYGHDYMRGGEVFGGYGYAEREEYETPRGELRSESKDGDATSEGDEDEELTGG
jgi:hypothetical protein